MRKVHPFRKFTQPDRDIATGDFVDWFEQCLRERLGTAAGFVQRIDGSKSPRSLHGLDRVSFADSFPVPKAPIPAMTGDSASKCSFHLV
jgi:hypothetical protein